jgi:DNA-binding NtrC family response regulator
MRQFSVVSSSCPEESKPRTLVGRDPRILELLDLVDQVAATGAPVLITGESGTGKEIVARELHARSLRRRGPFVAVNCGAIVDSLGESELFGHVPGAFTGALGRKRGKFEAADGGTLFLDEVGEMSPALQVKLLRALQTGEFSPVGMTETRVCDVRVIAATNQDLEAQIQSGAFRTDLFYRLNVIRLEVPPLRERRGDILPLARHFAAAFAGTYGLPEPDFTPELERTLLRWDYPGNVRELENILHRAVILGRDGALSARLLPPEMARGKGDDSPEATFHEAKERVIERFERDYLTSLLGNCGGIVSRAAARCGLSERNFHEKLKKYGIDGQSFRAPLHADAP